ncbi:MAG: SpoIIE family protein phosphatase [Bacillota bacterium]
MAAVIDKKVIESASAVFTLPGQSESGDRHVILHLPHGALVAVIDGLGHGSEAAAAAQRAVVNIEQYAEGDSLIALVKRCHAALVGTRGAVMNLAAFDTREDTLTWLGIGNVEGRILLRTTNPGYAQQGLLLRPGVVGQKLPRLQTSVTRVQRGDMVIFATDGIDPDFVEGVHTGDSTQEIAERIVTRYCKKNDDALALVVRYLG